MRRPKQTHARTAGTKTQRAADIVIPPDTDASFEILRPRKRPLSRAGLQARAGEAVTDLIWAVCRWGRGWTLGEYRFVVFSTDPSEDVNLYVQFWSEPQEEVCWEVCSGKWNPPADEVMAGAPSEYVERLGFTIGGAAENFQRDVWIRRRRDAVQAATVVLDIFYDAFGYRGLTSIDGHLVSESHGEMQRVHGAFTPEDLCKTARATRVDPAAARERGPGRRIGRGDRCAAGPRARAARAQRSRAGPTRLSVRVRGCRRSAASGRSANTRGPGGNTSLPRARTDARRPHVAFRRRGDGRLAAHASGLGAGNGATRSSDALTPRALIPVVRRPGLFHRAPRVGQGFSPAYYGASRPKACPH